MKKGDMCILVCSCDKYSDIWPIFFTFLKKNWGDCPYPIYLNTETKQYVDDYFKVTTLNDNKPNNTYSKRLINCLKRLNYKNVLIILDDFFLYEKVDGNKIEQSLQIINANKRIAMLNFKKGNKHIKDCIEDNLNGFLKRNSGEWYWVNLLPAIWKKKALLKILSPYESPWQLEWFGTERAKLSKYEYYNRYFGVDRILEYKINGYGLCQGKWEEGNVELFKENGIEVDFSIRGFCDRKNINFYVTVPKRTLRDKFRYLLYGGLKTIETDDGNIRLSIRYQLKLMFCHPKTFLKIMKRKFVYLFGLDKGKIVDSRVDEFVD